MNRIRNIGGRRFIPGTGRKGTVRIEFDTREFESRMDFVTIEMVKAIRRGLTIVGQRFIAAVIDQYPRAPVLTSALISSITVFINRSYKFSSRRRAIATRAPLDHRVFQLPQDVPTNAEEEALNIIFGAPYTSLQHEVYHPGFITEKIGRNYEKWVKIVADEVKRAFA